MNPSRTNLQWLEEKPFTLFLSAGFFGFYAHTGLLIAFEEYDLRPQRVVGASAGSLAGGLWAAGLKAEKIRARLENLQLQDFWDLNRIPFYPGLLRGRKFSRLLRDMLYVTGVQRVEDCPLPFAALTYDVFSRRSVVQENGSLEEVIRASCALPLMFGPVKVGRRWMLDGGIGDRAGSLAKSAGERTCTHYLLHRSPWPASEETPPSSLTGSDGKIIILPNLPSVSPFHLMRGVDAIEMAYRGVKEWLLE